MCWRQSVFPFPGVDKASPLGEKELWYWLYLVYCPHSRRSATLQLGRLMQSSSICLLLSTCRFPQYLFQHVAQPSNISHLCRFILCSIISITETACSSESNKKERASRFPLNFFWQTIRGAASSQADRASLIRWQSRQEAVPFTAPSFLQEKLFPSLIMHVIICPYFRAN